MKRKFWETQILQVRGYKRVFFGYYDGMNQYTFWRAKLILKIKKTLPEFVLGLLENYHNGYITTIYGNTFPMGSFPWMRKLEGDKLVSQKIMMIKNLKESIKQLKIQYKKLGVIIEKVIIEEDEEVKKLKK